MAKNNKKLVKIYANLYTYGYIFLASLIVLLLAESLQYLYYVVLILAICSIVCLARYNLNSKILVNYQDKSQKKLSFAQVVLRMLISMCCLAVTIRSAAEILLNNNPFNFEYHLAHGLGLQDFLLNNKYMWFISAIPLSLGLFVDRFSQGKYAVWPKLLIKDKSTYIKNFIYYELYNMHYFSQLILLSFNCIWIILLCNSYAKEFSLVQDPFVLIMGYVLLIAVFAPYVKKLHANFTNYPLCVWLGLILLGIIILLYLIGIVSLPFITLLPNLSQYFVLIQPKFANNLCLAKITAVLLGWQFLLVITLTPWWLAWMRKRKVKEFIVLSCLWPLVCYVFVYKGVGITPLLGLLLPMLMYFSMVNNLCKLLLGPLAAKNFAQPRAYTQQLAVIYRFINIMFFMWVFSGWRAVEMNVNLYIIVSAILFFVIFIKSLKIKEHRYLLSSQIL